MRPNRDKYFMAIARMVAKRSTCPRADVGAVLVDKDTNHIVATGYNGSAKGSIHCDKEGCLIFDGQCRRTIHAELNAVLHLERKYSELILYCTHQPCHNCIKALIGANVTSVIFHNRYPDTVRDCLQLETGIAMTQVDREGKWIQQND